MKKYFIFSLCFLFSASVFADVKISSGKIKISHVTSPTLNVFCNQIDAKIIINRTDWDNPGASAGWSSELPAHTCSVFFTDTGPWIFACSEESLHVWHSVDCKKDLLVGPLTWGGNMLSGEKVTGSYWVAEGISVDDVPLVVRHRGFDL